MVWYILDRVPQYRSTWYILDHNTGPHPDPARSSPITLCNAKTARNEAEIRISRKKIIKKSQQTLAMSQPSFITCTLNIVQNTMKGWYKCLRSISGICKVVSKRYTEGKSLSLWEARCLFWCLVMHLSGTWWLVLVHNQTICVPLFNRSQLRTHANLNTFRTTIILMVVIAPWGALYLTPPRDPIPSVSLSVIGRTENSEL